MMSFGAKQPIRNNDQSTSSSFALRANVELNRAPWRRLHAQSSPCRHARTSLTTPPVGVSLASLLDPRRDRLEQR